MISKQQLGNTLWGVAEILYDKVDADNAPAAAGILARRRPCSTA